MFAYGGKNVSLLLREPKNFAPALKNNNNNNRSAGGGGGGTSKKKLYWGRAIIMAMTDR